MTPYYPTINEDLTRAKDILAKGKLDDTAWSPDLPTDVRAALSQRASGAIYGGDVYEAYKLLESFVEELEQGTHRRMLNFTEMLQACDRCGESPVETEDEPVIYCAKCAKALKDDRDFWDKKAGEEHNTVTKFYGLFSDYDDPCTSFAQAEAIWNEMKDRHAKQGARLEKMIGELREQNHRIIKEREAALLEVARVSDLLDTFHTANDAVQDWVNTNASLVPEGLEQLLSELDMVLNGK